MIHPLLIDADRAAAQHKEERRPPIFFQAEQLIEEQRINEYTAALATKDLYREKKKIKTRIKDHRVIHQLLYC